jgi:hypothetical protein
LTQTVSVGANVSFSVVASGSSLNYQWRKNGVNIGGANAATYTRSNAQSADAGNYSVVVTIHTPGGLPAPLLLNVSFCGYHDGVSAQSQIDKRLQLIGL